MEGRKETRKQEKGTFKEVKEIIVGERELRCLQLVLADRHLMCIFETVLAYDAVMSVMLKKLIFNFEMCTSLTSTKAKVQFLVSVRQLRILSSRVTTIGMSNQHMATHSSFLHTTIAFLDGSHFILLLFQELSVLDFI